MISNVRLCIKFACCCISSNDADEDDDNCWSLLLKFLSVTCIVCNVDCVNTEYNINIYPKQINIIIIIIIINDDDDAFNCLFDNIIMLKGSIIIIYSTVKIFSYSTMPLKTTLIS